MLLLTKSTYYGAHDGMLSYMCFAGYLIWHVHKVASYVELCTQGIMGLVCVSVP